ncbi:GNAT family N-acetyltransferase [Actinomadura parmotrematis]|uniref:GNAT family N-acetyltransferase n=1 Tax=Actinomadura parmotrematis TaxID=2864039 RepID=A0ABS7G185_9ACTN|nr:GNAT family protein [Actinomadura parmotrematis]MBW8486453.1 GNAT family N-acetyltransferase [Actinomadura parmotrematis]
MLADHWPLFGLRVRTPRLELRLPTEDELSALADVAARGVHPPGARPFLHPWGELPPAQRGRTVLKDHWRRLGSWDPRDWELSLAVFEDGVPLGFQDIEGRDFAVLREVSTGSWLSLEHQGRGVGTEMRAAVLHLAFAGLGATDATTESFTDNPAPLEVSRRLGYRPDGIDHHVVRDEAVTTQRLRLTRNVWESTERPDVTIEGLAPCLELFGLQE